MKLVGSVLLVPSNFLRLQSSFTRGKTSRLCHYPFIECKVPYMANKSIISIVLLGYLLIYSACFMPQVQRRVIIEIHTTIISHQFSLLFDIFCIICFNNIFRTHYKFTADWKFKYLHWLSFYYLLLKKVKVLVPQLCPTLCDPHGQQPTRLLCPWNSLVENSEVGSHSFLQEIFLT